MKRDSDLWISGTFVSVRFFHILASGNISTFWGYFHMTHRVFTRFFILALTFFGTKHFSSHKIFKNNLHTYIVPLKRLYSRLLNYVGCLHEIEATYIKRGVLSIKTPYWDINLLIDRLFRLTYPLRNFLFRRGNRKFRRGNNMF